MKFKAQYIVPVMLLLIISCEQPLDGVMQAVNNTNDILKNNVWHLERFEVQVKNPDIPPPLFFDSSDSLIRKGMYGLDEMVLDASEMRKYEVNFTEERQVLTRFGQIDILGDSVGKYFVFNDRTIRITGSEGSLNYNYIYDQKAGTIFLTVDSEKAERLIRKINEKLIKNVANRTPNKIGDAIAGLLFNNEALQRLINNVLVSAISGQLEFINDFDPDQAADLLSREIIEALKSIDWEGKLTELLKGELEKITGIDPEAVSEAIAVEVAQFVNDQITVEGVYKLILPYMEDISTNPDGVSESVSTLIINLFFKVFNQDVLQDILADVWVKFTMIEEEKVAAIADTLTYLVEDIWINQENISNLILPFTQKIEETSILKMGELAAQTTDSLKVLIGAINETFPDLNLAPDYESLQSTLKTAFIAAKPVIGAVGGAEKAASEIGGLIISQFLNSDNISGTFVAAIQYLQSIDPEQAGSTIAGWLVNLKDAASDALIAYLSDLLSPILDNMNPELTAFKIAMALNDFVEQNVTAASIKSLILPLLEAIANTNAEAVAIYLAQQILGLDVIKDNVNEETIKAVLLPVLQAVQESNVDQLAQTLINAIVDSGIFEEVITEGRVSAIISLLIYYSAWENVKIVNNFEEAIITLRHD